ncbi:synapse-associated protein 1-like isoform X2 [Watersipora subatra]|uniref:synapse-associated protein 1-like isoform X2 n=1 Tax=Watersipora subatra TaxID=2589382 RepID=UPI00355C33F9
MFKAFTDNISSFIGSATGNKSEQGTQKTADDAADVGSSEETATAVTGEVPDKSSLENKLQTTSKIPPPRPSPPVAAAASVSSDDVPLSPDTSKQTSESTTGATSGSSDSNQESLAEEVNKTGRKEDNFEDVAEKAKEWGSYLLNMTKSAGASVGAKALELKKAVADNTILGDFAKEQDKFVSAKKEKARANEAAVPPWVGYNEEEQMRVQMLALSNDKRNFLRNPPTGVQFHFDYETCYPVAMATLGEDERLQEMRFKLVPKMVSEHDFWRNYFYRVSLIKQSTQLTSLAKQSSAGLASPESTTQTTSTNSKQDSTVEPAKDVKAADPVPSADITDAGHDDADVTAGNEEFISDAYNLEISDEDLIKEMEALRASASGDEALEDELQRELTDFELVGEGDVGYAALESAIMSEMSKGD